MAGVSIWSHFSHSTKPKHWTGSPIAIPGTVLSFWLVLFPYLNHHLMPQTSHPGPRELQPCPEEDLWDEDCTRTDLTQPDNAGVTLADDDTTQKEASAGPLLDTGALPWMWRGNNRRAGILLPGTVNALRTSGGGAVTPHTLCILEEILWRI